MFFITQQRKDGVLIFSVGGRIDGGNARDFRKDMLKALDYNAGGIVMDLAELEYISSAGIREVFQVGKRVNKRKLKFVLCALQEGVWGVFRVMGFDKLLTVYPSREEALVAEFGG